MSDQLSADLASLRLPPPDPGAPGGGVWKYLLGGGLFLGALVLGYLLGYPYLEARVFKTEVAVTEIALVSPAQASVDLSATGYVVPQTISKVAPKVSGRVARVAVRQRDRVKAGDVLVVLDDVDQRTAASAARARLLAARARAQTARANYEEIGLQAGRARALATRGVGPQANAVDLEARVHSLDTAIRAADAEVAAAQADLETQRLGLSYTTIAAPISGTVVSKPVEVGEYVGPQSTILELADFNTLEVEVDVPEARLPLIKEDGPAEIVLDAYPSERRRGRTLEVSPRINRAKGTVTVKVRFADSLDRVLPEMAARVSFLRGELSAAALKEAPRLLCPAAAVTERAGAKVVFALDGDQVRMTPVVLGAALGSGYEILRGPPPAPAWSRTRRGSSATARRSRKRSTREERT